MNYLLLSSVRIPINQILVYHISIILRGTGLPYKFQFLFLEKNREEPEERNLEYIQAEMMRITKRPELIVSDVTWKGVWR